MFSSLNNLFIGSRDASKEDYKVSLVGLDNAGKTTLLYEMKLGERITSTPTAGMNIEEIKVVSDIPVAEMAAVKKQLLRPTNSSEASSSAAFVKRNASKARFAIWDIGGGPLFRPLWKMYLKQNSADVMMWTVDSLCPERLQESAEALAQAMRYLGEVDAMDKLKHVIVVCNKSYRSGAANIAKDRKSLQGAQPGPHGECLLAGDICDALQLFSHGVPFSAVYNPSQWFSYNHSEGEGGTLQHPALGELRRYIDPTFDTSAAGVAALEAGLTALAATATATEDGSLNPARRTGGGSSSQNPLLAAPGVGRKADAGADSEADSEPDSEAVSEADSEAAADSEAGALHELDLEQEQELDLVYEHQQHQQHQHSPQRQRQWQQRQEQHQQEEEEEGQQEQEHGESDGHSHDHIHTLD